MTVLFAVIACVWLGVTVSALRALRWLRALPALPPDGTERATVTAVVPARDEEDRIGPTVERLLAQRGVELDVVVVDDRSRDRTGAIVAALGERDGRVRLARVAELPAGWLGKPHACQTGAERARGEWLLFTDGDAWLAEDVVARSVAAARASGADHVTLGVHVDGASLAAHAGVAAFGGALMGELARANRDDPRSGAGIGAFNLVRAEAWRAIGGHAALAYEVVDDLRLGRLLRRGGFRTRAYLSRGEVSVHWARTAWDVVRRLEKNFFAQLGYSAPRAVLAVAGILAVWLGALAGPFHGGIAGWSALAALLSTCVPAWIGSRRQRMPLLPGLLAPLFVWLLPVALANSAWRTLRAGGVSWRGTFYPLAELRARRVP
jgi:hypothetical protein